ncbi:hypothetical protein OIDMADRAFT_161651 [Oidiodendron maius Zn]|uniref:Solute carrier family 40 member n=1 Tax=Oidiodendron maius (strain Zn) TaxID=913774 RepID=A0A0C3CSF3_OIDMZ|nr:hypothetical protein OIDMADRAFT_161651 [Oidiodendron maius Zn]
MTRSQAWNLYTSHFLSTWNARTYEFAAVIFMASVYPDTLIATSIRISVLCASVLWFFIVQPDNGDDVTPFSSSGSLGVSHVWREAIFALIIATGILEGLSASGNMLSMERDWVVTAASPYGQRYDLTELNSSMRRIDLICKLIAPIAISVAISLTNIRIGVMIVGTMSTISWTAECWCARRVWLQNPKLMAPKDVTDRDSQETMTSPGHTGFFSRAGQNIRRYVADFRMYFSSPVWIPSLSLALLHISALAYNATFMTYLLAVGFSLDLITFARAAGSVVEISSTVVTPVGVKYLGNPKTQGHHSISRDGEDEPAGPLLETPQETDGAKTEMGLERLGLWGISFQLINLVPVVFALWNLSSDPTTPSVLAVFPRFTGRLTSQPRLAFILFFFLSISRLGLWIYDLTTQQLTQSMTIASQRSSFAGVEYSFVCMFELAQHGVSIILHRPDQFKWIALISFISVITSTTAYARWVWKMRGHLVHWEKIGAVCECVELRAGRWRGGI